MIECIKVRTQSPWVVAHKNGTTAYEKLQKEQKKLGIVMEKFKEISGILIKNLVFQEGGKEMMGLTPAGDLERKVQEFPTNTTTIRVALRAQIGLKNK